MGEGRFWGFEDFLYLEKPEPARSGAALANQAFPPPQAARGKTPYPLLSLMQLFPPPGRHSPAAGREGSGHRAGRLPGEPAALPDDPAGGPGDGCVAEANAEEGQDWPEHDPPPHPPHCHIPVGQPRGDPCLGEGAPCCPLKSRPDLGLDSEELWHLT